MNTKVLIELIGYLGSALVVVSMLMTSVVKLRIVNTVGSAIFMGYALVIGSYPTAVMNFFLIAINVWHLIRLLRSHKEYDLIETRLGDSFVSYFLEKNLQDIRELGMDQFLENEREQWTCGECGHVVAVHTGICSGCGKQYGRQE